MRLDVDESRRIIHVDMDAFYAAVETRDNPALLGKPVIIGSLPGERGVVATCNYKAREFGVRSAMPINEAYKRCPHGHFMYPNMKKYQRVSEEIRQIWLTYTDVVEFVALDEAFLDVSDSLRLFGGYKEIARQIKAQTWEKLGLTCSVGVGYSMSSAKLASEEKKPNGYFEILTADAMRRLIGPRSVRVVYTVGAKTAERLERLGIRYVNDIFHHEKRIQDVMGLHGEQIVALAKGIDSRVVGTRTRGQSMGTERTFQKDVTDVSYLKHVLRLIARKLSFDAMSKGLYAKTVTLKITYPGMISITRAKSGEPIHDALSIFKRVESLLDALEKKPVRLIGITLSNFTKEKEEKIVGHQQMSLFDQRAVLDEGLKQKKDPEVINHLLLTLQQTHGKNIIKSGSELSAEQFLKEASEGEEK